MMTYATQYYIGNNQNSRTTKAKTIAPTVERVRQLDAKAKRCKRSAERQTEICTDNNATNGFLKCTFLPKLKETETVQVCKQTVKMQRDFCQSLSKLAEYYNIEPMQSKDFGFPYNIALSMWNMEEKLKQTNANWDSLKLIQDSKKTYFVTEERYNTGTTVYYIPI